MKFTFKRPLLTVVILSLLLVVTLLSFSLVAQFAYAQGPIFAPPPAQPLAIDSFSISPSSLYPGQSASLQLNYTPSGAQQVGLCFYVPSTLTTTVEFSAASGYTKLTGTFTCLTSPPAGFDVVAAYTTTVTFGSVPPFDATFTVYASAPPGTNYQIGVAVFEGSNCSDPGGTNCNTLGGTSSVYFDILSQPSTAFADPNGSCGGNTPCYTSLTDPNTGALAAVATGGTVRVYGDFSASSLTIDKNLTLEGTSGSQIGPVTVNSGVAVTLRGNTINGGGGTALTNNGTVLAYANNFSNFTTALSGTGTTQVPHNWWGQYNTQPPSVPASDWNKRLGAQVVSWGVGQLGNARLTPNGGSGTGVIVSHGRTNVPFDQGQLPYSGQVCSDYYDFFVINGTGDWQVTVPVDNIGACDTPLTNMKMFVFATLDNTPDFATCANGPSPSADPQCWDSVVDAGSESISADFNARTLSWTSASVGELGGTPIVAGTVGGTDPTAVTLESFSGVVFAPVNRLVAGLAGLLGIAVLALTVVTWRWGRRA